MDDEDDQMLLNLTTTHAKESKLFDKNEDKPNKRKVNHSKQPKHVIKKKFSSVNKKVSQNQIPGKFQIISSLFRKNPEIPEISNDVLQSNSKHSQEDQTFSASEFNHLKLAPFMISNLEKNLHMTKMTSVQKASIPLLIDGKDMLIKSPTGTGKTLVYVIPVVQSLQAITPKIKREDGPYCVVLVPTRELVVQSLTAIQQVLKPFIWIVPGCVTGGEKRKSEKARLRKGINILVATPGRLVDHLQTTQCLKFDNLQFLILDEADRLLDMGFEQELSFILSTIKDQSIKKSQTVLLSATLTQGVEKLADITLDNPITIDMTEHDSTALDGDKIEFETPTQLKQFCVVVPMKLRLVTLAAFLKQNDEPNSKMIVFFTTQDSVDFHYRLFTTTLTVEKGRSMALMKLHGKLSQQERTKIFLDFRDSNNGVLLCTDVAARGLDLPSVNWIVQYNPPASVTDYVHRVGRTARIGSSGQALLFLLPTEVGFLKVLSQQNLRLYEIKIDDILCILSEKQSSRSSKDLDKERFHAVVTSQHLLFEEALNETNNKELKELALTAFCSFIGAYNTFPTSMKSVFHPRNLHLGHLAKSFALRETPTELKQEIPKRKRKRIIFTSFQKDNKEFKGSRNLISESKSDGCFSGPLPKKLKRTATK